VENRKIMLLAPLVSLHNCGRVRAYLYFSDPVRDTAEKSVQETTLISRLASPLCSPAKLCFWLPRSNATLRVRSSWLRAGRA
jgi:hypothetical protein